MTTSSCCSPVDCRLVSADAGHNERREVQGLPLLVVFAEAGSARGHRLARLVENARSILSQKDDRSDCHDRDQRDEQRVLDEAGALFGANQALDFRPETKYVLPPQLPGDPRRIFR